jgi:hypothetical protein
LSPRLSPQLGEARHVVFAPSAHARSDRMQKHTNSVGFYLSPYDWPNPIADKRFHAQIGELYPPHCKGAYAGREAEWDRIQADIFAAQREGRVQGVYLTK